MLRPAGALELHKACGRSPRAGLPSRLHRRLGRGGDGFQSDQVGKLVSAEIQVIFLRQADRFPVGGGGHDGQDRADDAPDTLKVLREVPRRIAALRVVHMTQQNDTRAELHRRIGEGCRRERVDVVEQSFLLIIGQCSPFAAPAWRGCCGPSFSAEASYRSWRSPQSWAMRPSSTIEGNGMVVSVVGMVQLLRRSCRLMGLGRIGKFASSRPAAFLLYGNHVTVNSR